MSDGKEEEKQTSIFSAHATAKDLFGLSTAGPGIGKAVNRLAKAAAEGLGMVTEPAKTVLDALASRFAERQRRKSALAHCTSWTAS